MGFCYRDGMLLRIQIMKCFLQRTSCLLITALLALGLALDSEAKSYSSGGGHSYSSHSSSSGGSHSSSSGGSHSFSSGSHSVSSGSSRSSSGSSSHNSSSSSPRSSSSGGGGSKSFSSGGHSFSSGGSQGSSGSSSHSSRGSTAGSKNFSSSSGRSYSSESSASDSGRHSYTSGKSYGATSGHTFSSRSASGDQPAKAKVSASPAPDSTPSSFTFDTAAARARKEEASKAKFTEFKDSQVAQRTAPSPPPSAGADAASYRVKPPPISNSGGGYSYRPTAYVPDTQVIVTRPTRIYTVFNPYSSRPWVVYHDPYSSLFWWWLLDRSLDDRAYWAYHHRYDMDPARYQALLATDQQLESRVEQLEAHQAPRDPTYVPTGLDRDLMYSDQYVQRTYSNRPTAFGVITFWALGIPLAVAFVAFFIWLIWFKRWQTAT
jgi:hypothetical protein